MITQTHNKKEVSTKVPVLRFPEFSGEWEEKKLGDFIQSYVERVSSKTGISVYSSSRNGLKPQREYYDDRELQNDGEYGIVPRGFFTYRHMSDDLTFKFNINTFEDKIAVSKEYPVFKTVGLDSVFLLCKLNHGKDFKSFAIKQKMGGTRTRLYFKNLSNWKASFPSLLEQQKIAEFFGVVDEKIAGLSKKKASLERYKKGVMQKIFSNEIRFKDENGNSYPDWKEKAFLEVFRVIPSKKYQIKSSEICNEGNCPVVDQSPDIIAGYSEKTEKLSKDAPVIIFGDHTTVVKYIDFDFVIGADGTKILKNNSGVLKYLYYCLLFNNVEQEGYKRHFSILNKLSLQWPVDEEQKKITDFLASLDEKISAIGNELSYAKEFKKGLLQQMFV